MKRRLLAAVAALLLLVVGTVVLLGYVRGAEARALDGVRTTEVLVADQVIPEGTPADELAALVRTEVLPRKAVLDGGVTDIGALTGQVATVDIQPGEQLLTVRFGEVDDLGAPGTVPVPEGLQEVSVQLEPQRAVGGRLAAGDTVGVVVSQTQGEDGARTRTVLNRILVTQVQGAPAPVEQDAGGAGTTSTGSAAPTSSLLITLAVTGAQADAVVFGAEHGTLWLALQPAGARPGATDVVTGATIYEKDLS